MDDYSLLLSLTPHLLIAPLGVDCKFAVLNNNNKKNLTEQHFKFMLHTVQVLYMCTLCDSTNINTIIEFVPN